MIQPGTLCYLTRLIDTDRECNGRVVTAVRWIDHGEFKGYWRVDAPWIAAHFPGIREHYAIPGRLRPIHGPGAVVDERQAEHAS